MMYTKLEDLQMDIERESLYISYSQAAVLRLFNGICKAIRIIYWLWITVLISSAIFRYIPDMNYLVATIATIVGGILFAGLADVVREEMDREFYIMVFSIAKAKFKRYIEYDNYTDEQIDEVFMKELYPFTGIKEEFKNIYYMV